MSLLAATKMHTSQAQNMGAQVVSIWKRATELCQERGKTGSTVVCCNSGPATNDTVLVQTKTGQKPRKLEDLSSGLKRCREVAAGGLLADCEVMGKTKEIMYHRTLRRLLTLGVKNADAVCSQKKCSHRKNNAAAVDQESKKMVPTYNDLKFNRKDLKAYKDHFVPGFQLLVGIQPNPWTFFTIDTIDHPDAVDLLNIIYIAAMELSQQLYKYCHTFMQEAHPVIKEHLEQVICTPGTAADPEAQMTYQFNTLDNICKEVERLLKDNIFIYMKSATQEGMYCSRISITAKCPPPVWALGKYINPKILSKTEAQFFSSKWAAVTARHIKAISEEMEDKEFEPFWEDFLRRLCLCYNKRISCHCLCLLTLPTPLLLLVIMFAWLPQTLLRTTSYFILPGHSVSTA
ncbi:hypothetical protein BDV98DRAFT_580879 [Pterulicium gracile]|uniref:Uncharacterized protein n=1 Tax=Pterulicium gracile TaxID=1884261 RepID=A0A5C3QU21_9AGAR|nr:hypothetical protein BDV98DRAFT_580879 [Pterula gracilis]